jgi:hypothetical protein
MGLIKQYSTRGIDITYWHIYYLSYKKDINKTMVRFRGYVDYQTRENDINDWVDMPGCVVTYELDGQQNMYNAYELCKDCIHYVETVNPYTGETETTEVPGFFQGAEDF